MQQRPRMGLLILNVAHNNEVYGNMVTTMRMKSIVPSSSEPRPARGTVEHEDERAREHLERPTQAKRCLVRAGGLGRRGRALGSLESANPSVACAGLRVNCYNARAWLIGDRYRHVSARPRPAATLPRSSRELYERTRDAMVAFELAQWHEKAGNASETVQWYTTAAQRFRRAQWRTKAEEALTRLGAPIPEPLPGPASGRIGRRRHFRWRAARRRASPERCLRS